MSKYKLIQNSLLSKIPIEQQKEYFKLTTVLFLIENKVYESCNNIFEHEFVDSEFKLFTFDLEFIFDSYNIEFKENYIKILIDSLYKDFKNNNIEINYIKRLDNYLEISILSDNHIKHKIQYLVMNYLIHDYNFNKTLYKVFKLNLIFDSYFFNTINDLKLYESKFPISYDMGIYDIIVDKVYSKVVKNGFITNDDLIKLIKKKTHKVIKKLDFLYLYDLYEKSYYNTKTLYQLECIEELIDIIINENNIDISDLEYIKWKCISLERLEDIFNIANLIDRNKVTQIINDVYNEFIK